jgi:1,3-beta-glucan synthase
MRCFLSPQVADLIAFGDGGFFTDRIITPIFYVMSYEIDHLSNLGVDTAHRYVL